VGDRLEARRVFDAHTEVELARDVETVAQGELRYVFIESGGGAKQLLPDRIRDQLSACS
jgi:acyl-CoA thioesterase FadM